MSEERSIAVRNGGGVEQVNPEQTRALWAAVGGTNLTPEVVKALALIGRQYALDPAIGEICILGGKPYITLAGYLKIASRFPQYEGYELWPLSDGERKSLMVGSDEAAFGCKVWRKDKRFPFPGWGVANDRTVTMGSMKPFIREVAQKRAIHRALRAAFPVGFPDVDDDGQIVVEVLDRDETPPSELPEPDWASWWIAVDGLGVIPAEAHRILGVESVKDWAGSLEEAYQRIEKHVADRERAKQEEQRLTNVKKWTREKLIDHYARRCDDADVLGIPHKPFDLTWTDEQIVSEGEALKAAIKGREATIPGNGGQA